jgi:hypothetical protein
MYAQPSPHREVHRLFPGPTRGVVVTLRGFSPMSTHCGLGLSPPLLPIYVTHYAYIKSLISVTLLFL